MKIFFSSGMERKWKCYVRTDGRTDWRTGKGHSYNPLSALRRGLMTIDLELWSLDLQTNTLSTERVGLLCKLIKTIMEPVSLFPLNKLDCSSLPPQPSIISYIHCSPYSSLFPCPPKNKFSICFLVSLIPPPPPRFSKPLGWYHNVKLFFICTACETSQGWFLKKSQNRSKVKFD